MVSTPVPALGRAPGGPPRSAGRPVPRPLPYALLLPTAVLLAAVLAYPLGRQVVMSAQEYGLAQQFGRPPEWVGLDNYRALVGDPALWAVLARTVAFCLVNAAVTMVLGCGIALLMTRLGAPVRLLVQVSLLLAWAMPVLAALTVWVWLFDAQYGVVNHVLTRLGGDFAQHSWLLDPLSFYFVATVVVVWMSVPFVALTAYAALTQVPGEVVEAAVLDGAGPGQRLRHVVWPVVRPVLTVVGLLQVVWDLRVFSHIYVLQNAGGVSSETNLLGTYVYRVGIAEGRFGTSAAAAMLLLVLTAVLTAVLVRSMLRQDAA